jgi:hypothetical protein
MASSMSPGHKIKTFVGKMFTSKAHQPRRSAACIRDREIACMWRGSGERGREPSEQT